jgi:hypothetical protein
VLAPVQTRPNVGATGSPLTATDTLTVTAGNAVFVAIGSNTAASTRNYTVSDDVMGTTGWRRDVSRSAANAFGCEIWVNPNHTGGTVTITVTHGQGSGGFTISVGEFSGFGGTVVCDASDFFIDPNVADNHVCSSSGVSSANEVMAICAGWLEAAATSTAAGSGYTLMGSGGNQFLVGQYQHFPAGCANEQGAWTSTGTDRRGRGAIGLFSGAGGGGGATANPPAGALALAGGATRMNFGINIPTDTI